MTILENWQKWTSFLGQNVMRAESSGMSSQMIQQAAVQIENIWRQMSILKRTRASAVGFMGRCL